MRPDTAMFFAAGFGTRMRPLTDTIPKPLIKVGATTLLDHALDLAEAGGVTRRVVNTHYLGDRIRDHLSGRDIAISDETETILDTGGGLRAALPMLGPDPVFTMNSDAVWRGPNPFDVLRNAWDDRRMGALLLIVPTAAALGHSGSGDFNIAADGQISRGTDAVYTGAQIIRTETLHEVEADVFSLNVVWNRFAGEGRLFGVRYPGRWCDVGRPESLPLAESLLTTADV